MKLSERIKRAEKRWETKKLSCAEALITALELVSVELAYQRGERGSHRMASGNLATEERIKHLKRTEAVLKDMHDQIEESGK